jgi:hypothetical protein
VRTFELSGVITGSGQHRGVLHCMRTQQMDTNRDGGGPLKRRSVLSAALIGGAAAVVGSQHRAHAGVLDRRSLSTDDRQAMREIALRYFGHRLPKR